MDTLFICSIVFSLLYIEIQAEKEARRNRRFTKIPCRNDFVQNDFQQAA